MSTVFIVLSHCEQGVDENSHVMGCFGSIEEAETCASKVPGYVEIVRAVQGSSAQATRVVWLDKTASRPGYRATWDPENSAVRVWRIESVPDNRVPSQRGPMIINRGTSERPVVYCVDREAAIASVVYEVAIDKGEPVYKYNVVDEHACSS